MKCSKWGIFVPSYVFTENRNFWLRLSEIYWVAIMFTGYPFFSLCEWIHWEIYGKGPRKK